MLLTIKEVADRLNVSLSFAYQLVAGGKLASHRIGTGRGIIRVNVDDLNAYIASTRHEIQWPDPVARRKKLKHIRL